MGDVDQFFRQVFSMARSEFSKNAQFTRGEVRIVECSLRDHVLSHVVVHLLRPYFDGLIEIGVKVVPDLHQSGWYRPHLPGAVFHAGDRPASLAEVLEVEQIEQLEQLDFAKTARVPGEVQNGVDQLVAGARNEHAISSAHA
jgi:hypothetical protein